MRYNRGTVLKWTRAAMARGHELGPKDRMIALRAGELPGSIVSVLYDAETNEVRQTDFLVVRDSDVVEWSGGETGGLRIDVREMSDDPDIPALIAEFDMERT